MTRHLKNASKIINQYKYNPSDLLLMRYCVQFENHDFLLITSRALTQFPWRDFQTKRKNITFKTLNILTFQKTCENPEKIHTIAFPLR